MECEVCGKPATVCYQKVWAKFALQENVMVFEEVSKPDGEAKSEYYCDEHKGQFMGD